MDRSSDDHCGEREQGISTQVFGIHDRGQDAKAGHRQNSLRARESAGWKTDDAGRGQDSASGRRGQLSEADLFLAEYAAARQVHRDLERCEGGAIEGSAKMFTR